MHPPKSGTSSMIIDIVIDIVSIIGVILLQISSHSGTVETLAMLCGY